VWYGTDQGTCGMVQFHRNILTKEVLALYISLETYCY